MKKVRQGPLPQVLRAPAARGADPLEGLVHVDHGEPGLRGGSRPHVPDRRVPHPDAPLAQLTRKEGNRDLQKKQRRTDRSPILCGAFASCLPRGRGSLRISCRFSGNEESRLDSFAFLY